MEALINNEIVEVTPELLAEQFCNLGQDEQARFYNRVAEVATNIGSPDGCWFPLQLQAITDDDGLTLGGRRVMQYIGEYSHWGLK